MVAYYRGRTIEKRMKAGAHWFLVDGSARTFESTAAAVAWIDRTRESCIAERTPRCELSRPVPRRQVAVPSARRHMRPAHHG